jgi:hypothetical protein
MGRFLRLGMGMLSGWIKTHGCKETSIKYAVLTFCLTYLLIFAITFYSTKEDKALS